MTSRAIVGTHEVGVIALVRKDGSLERVPLVTLEDAANQLRLSPRRVKRLVSLGVLGCLTVDDIPGMVWVTEPQLDSFVEQRGTQPPLWEDGSMP
jgi:hypothetical protein